MDVTCACRQQWAIARRYGIILSTTPIRSIVRLIAWPGLLITLVIFGLDAFSDLDPKQKMNSFKLVPQFIMVLTIFHMYSFGEMLIKDKASGMKSLMISMGLVRFNYYCAKSICSLMYLLPVCCIIAVIMKIYLFDATVTAATFILFMALVAIHLDSLMFFIVSFITSTNYSFIILILVFFERVLGAWANSSVLNLSTRLQPSALFILSSSPFETVNLYLNDYLVKHSDQKTPTDRGLASAENKVATQEIHLIFIAQVFWILFYRLFACWFEEVCPWQTSSAVQNLCFCLETQDDRYEGAIQESSDSRERPYFEQKIASNKDIGIQIVSVNKKFNNVPAVSDISFTIYKGETTLLLGHNGAGKSTLMNMILGLLRPDSGKVRINVRSRSEGVSSIGVCPQASILDDELNVRQHLELFNDIKICSMGHERSFHIEQTMNDVSLSEHAKKRPDELSGGMKRKLSLGMAFVGKSKVLILDEPSSGLDPDSRTFIWNAIRRYRADRTVLLSTQHMEEADYLGDRIAIMSGGRIICCGSSVYLNNLFGTGYKLRVECRMSLRRQILAHVCKYFDQARAVDEDDTTRRDKTDPTVDFVIELKAGSLNKDTELELIKLLEDLENNMQRLQIQSYGLKSSSIEDVMLTTSKQFASLEQNDATQLIVTSRQAHIANLVDPKNKSRSTNSLGFMYALIEKTLNIYLANWFVILLIKLILPIVGTYSIVSGSINTPNSITEFWQNPTACLLIAHFVYLPARERITKFKIVQLDSQLPSWTYWCANIVVDSLTVILSLISLNTFLLSFLEVKLQISAFAFHLMTTGVTVLLCYAGMMFCYVLAYLMNEPKSAYGYTLIVGISGYLIFIIFYIFRSAVLKGDLPWLQTCVGYISAAILPNDAYSLFFVGLYDRCYFELNGLPCTVKDDSSRIILALVFLIGQIVVYGFLLAMVEMQIVNIEWYCNMRNIIYWFNATTNPIVQREIDRDVVEENAKALHLINNRNESNHSLVAARLKKSYIKGNNIIQNLSFTVNKGECFGLLGVNGAGKSTTFSMLASESRPDSGKILAGRSYLHRDLKKYRNQIGYDPQATPELSLTPIQALQLMARLRGVSEARIRLLVDSLLDLLDMAQHGNKLDTELSGGTKRKLALGMSLIGRVSILALDEPTAGVDPLARRSIWQLLKSLRSQSNSAIVISSHAMEECEAICDRITIMARGRLRCIGTFLHLRSKFARGCTLRIQFRQVAPPTLNWGARSSSNSSRRSSDCLNDRVVQELKDLLTATIGAGVFKLADRNVNSLTFDITDNRVRRSLLFRMMREFNLKHPNASYMLNDSSLEDIFISLAREQQELERLSSP